MKFLGTISALLARYTSAFVIATAVFTYYFPGAFAWVEGSVQTFILGFIMLTMGMTLSVRDFRVVAERPWDICAAAVAQYTIMPLLAFAIAKLLGLSPALTAGLLLIGCCPGGVSSNIMSFIGRGDVAFSVGTTSVSTILAPLLTPFLCLHLAGQSIEVDAMGMFVSILVSVVGPVALGFAANLFLGGTNGYKSLMPFMPGLSVIGLACIVGGVTSAHGAKFVDSAAIMFVAIFLHNTAGYALGYFAGWLARMSVPKRRTMSLEVGMQNAGLATVLAGRHFPMYPDAAIASAVACVYHSISGAILAGLFLWRDNRSRTHFAAMSLVVLLAAVTSGGCLSYSDAQYVKRAKAARAVPAGEVAQPGRIYFASYPRNRLAVSILGWMPEVGHAAVATRDGDGVLSFYDYGWFVGHEEDGAAAKDPHELGVVGYPGDSHSYGAVRSVRLKGDFGGKPDMEVAKALLDVPGPYGDVLELWAVDVPDVGVTERYLKGFAEDRDRGSMALHVWHPGGYRCGNVARQAFDAARGGCGHFLDLLWGGFPGADAPSIGTEKTVYDGESAGDGRGLDFLL